MIEALLAVALVAAVCAFVWLLDRQNRRLYTHIELEREERQRWADRVQVPESAPARAFDLPTERQYAHLEDDEDVIAALEEMS